MHTSTLGGKDGRETPDDKGTGTNPKKTDTIPFLGINYRSTLYRETSTIGAAAAVSVQKRDDITCNDDVEQPLKDPIVRSQTRFREGRWSGRNKAGTSLVTNARVQSKNGIKAEKGDGPYSEDDIPFAGPHIFEIMCGDCANKDNQVEEPDKNAEKARGLKEQANHYEWVSTVEDNGYLHEFGPEPTDGKVSVDHGSFSTTVSIHGGRKATKKHKSVSLLDNGSPCSFVTQ